MFERFATPCDMPMRQGQVVEVLVTGANEFIGRNVCAALHRRKDVRLRGHDLDDTAEELDATLQTADVVFHLAGVHRPRLVEEFETGNAGFTREICRRLEGFARTPKIVLSSSIQAELDNPYGASKRGAEQALRQFCERTGAAGVIHRLKNEFGKWCRPNYNSVTATFCHNTANGLPIQVSDPAHEVDLVYIDDVVSAFLAELDAPAEPGCRFADPLPSHRIALGELAARIEFFRDSRLTLLVPDFSDPFNRHLYATYLSYLGCSDFAYQLNVKSDDRGVLAEFEKSSHSGQIFVSRTRPGAIRGDHYHDTKTEKFMVVEGEGIIRFRRIGADRVIEYRVSGHQFRVVDIPPGYTHSIENVGDTEMVTLFWACEIFDSERSDTHFEPVIHATDERV